MRSIAVTKPDMGVLPRERVLLSPFGMLAQAFAQDVLARAEQREGLWPFLPLELLEEGGESAPPAAPAPVNLQVDLRLALEALRREGGETQQERAAQRIVERVIQMHSLHTAPGTGQDGKKTGGREGGPQKGTNCCFFRCAHGKVWLGCGRAFNFIILVINMGHTISSLPPQ